MNNAQHLCGHPTSRGVPCRLPADLDAGRCHYHAPSRARCGARTRSGGRCANYPMQYAKRCRMHGSRSGRAVTAAHRIRRRHAAAAAAAELGLPVVRTAPTPPRGWRIRQRESELGITPLGHSSPPAATAGQGGGTVTRT
jgi:hypothetical protein